MVPSKILLSLMVFNQRIHLLKTPIGMVIVTAPTGNTSPLPPPQLGDCSGPHRQYQPPSRYPAW